VRVVVCVVPPRHARLVCAGQGGPEHT
jgi:hypothetical protein